MNGKLSYTAKMLLCAVLLLPLTGHAQSNDSTMSILLKEVAVKAQRDLYKTTSDAIIYNVSSDSTLIGKNSLEALRNAPLLRVERNGNIRSVGNWPVEFLVNGTHDISIIGNIHDGMESLDAKYLKRIEARITRDANGQEKLEVNIVTKGRLLGYRGIAASRVTDSSWRNGAYLFTKKNRLGISLSYYNTWRFGHSSKTDQEEWRYGSKELYHTNYHSSYSGYRTDLNDFALNMSYELSPLKVFSFYGRALFKVHPHSRSVSTQTAETSEGQQTYKYRKPSDYKASEDGEYTAQMDYEQLFGENAERGKFYASYEYFSRPTNETRKGGYSLLEFLDSAYVANFYDYTQNSRTPSSWHTLTLYYNRKLGAHRIYAEDFLRYRDEKEKINEQKNYRYRANPYTLTDREDYRHRQIANGLKAGYGYTGRKFSAQAGGNWQFVRDFSERPLLHDNYAASQNFLTPYADISYMLTSKSTLRLAYSMLKQIPSVDALNPYVYTSTPGEISYGNPKLKAQTSQQFSLTFNTRIGKYSLFASSTHSFAKDIILQHSFLDGNILNTTTGNIGKRYENLTKASVSAKATRTTWITAEANLYYTNYLKNSVYKRNSGCTFTASAYVEKELPRNFDISLGTGYNSPYIYMQGKGGEDFYYNLSIYKSFPKQRLTISAEANSFIPIKYDETSTSQSAGYFSKYRSRGFHASFALSLRWRFGKLKAEEHQSEGKYEHDDIKEDFSQ